jgi:hypothetical protein
VIQTPCKDKSKTHHKGGKGDIEGPNEGPKGPNEGSEGPNERPKGLDTGPDRPNEGQKQANQATTTMYRTNLMGCATVGP